MVGGARLSGEALYDAAAPWFKEMRNEAAGQASPIRMHLQGPAASSTIKRPVIITGDNGTAMAGPVRKS
jgi:hypothetical protein